MNKVIHAALFESLAPGAIVKLFPKDFHKSLRELIAATITGGRERRRRRQQQQERGEALSAGARLPPENMPAWQEAAMSQQVSLPKLEDFDWRVDIKAASDVMSRMSTPTVFVQMRVRGSWRAARGWRRVARCRARLLGARARCGTCRGEQTRSPTRGASRSS